MRIPWTTVVVAFLAGAAGAAAALLVGNRPGQPPSSTSVPSAGPRSPEEERIARLEQRLRAIENLPPSGGQAPGESPGSTPAPPGTAPSPGNPADRPATMAEVRAFLAERLKEDDRPAPDPRFPLGVGDAGTKSLEEAAKELGLRPEQVLKVQEAFRAEGEEQLKAAFGTDDIGAIREKVRDAEEDPADRAKLQETLLANLMQALPRIHRAEAGKVAALKETLGSETYDRFRRLGVREGASDEFDALLEQTFGTAEEEAGEGRK